MSQVADVITRVINDANSDVVISAGTLHHLCYNSPQVLDAVREALGRKVHFVVVTGPDIDIKSGTFISMLHDSIYITPTKPRVHFTVADGGKRLRFEKKDVDDNGNAENAERKNDYITGSYLKVKLLATLKEAKLYKEIIISKEQICNK